MIKTLITVREDVPRLYVEQILNSTFATVHKTEERTAVTVLSPNLTKEETIAEGWSRDNDFPIKKGKIEDLVMEADLFLMFYTKVENVLQIPMLEEAIDRKLKTYVFQSADMEVLAFHNYDR